MTGVVYESALRPAWEVRSKPHDRQPEGIRHCTVPLRWSAAAESLESGVSPITVAHRHDIGNGQLYTWRRRLPEGSLVATAQQGAQFARAEVMAVSETLGAPADGQHKLGMSAPDGSIGASSFTL